MAKLSLQERAKLPAEDFGDPAKRLFPIVDQGDLENSFKSHIHADDPATVKKNLHAIADRKGLKVPDWAHKNDDDENDDDDDDDTPTGTAYEDDGGEGGEGDGGGDEGGGEGGDDAEMSANFSLSEDNTEDNGWVIREAPILFRAGDYADKNFSLSPEELLGNVKTFSSPVDIDLEHKPSVLNGKLGSVISIGSSPDGQVMSGKARIPKWLDEVLEKDNRQLSAAFDRRTKKLIGVSLVRTPRVSDARLVAAFSKSVPLDGSVVATNDKPPAPGSEANPDAAATPEQEMKETVAASMGLWRGSMPKAAFEACPDDKRSSEGQGVLAKIHAITSEHCKTAGFDGAGMTSYEMEKVQAIHDMVAEDVKKSKESGGTYPSQRDDAGINDAKKLNAPAAKPDESPTPLTNLQAAPAADAGVTPSTAGTTQGGEAHGRSPYEGFSAEAKATVDAMTKQLKDMNDKRIAAESVVFADGEIAGKRALPAERDSLIVSFTLASNDDLKNLGPVTFDGQSLSRVEFLKRQQLKRPAHGLTGEFVQTQANGGNAALFNRGETSPAAGATMSDDRRKELLAQTSLGRLVSQPAKK